MHHWWQLQQFLVFQLQLLHLPASSELSEQQVIHFFYPVASAFPPREMWQGIWREKRVGSPAQPIFALVLLRVCQTNANRRDELQSASAPPLVECWNSLGLYNLQHFDNRYIYNRTSMCMYVWSICMNCIIYGHCVFNGLRRLSGPYGCTYGFFFLDSQRFSNFVLAFLPGPLQWQRAYMARIGIEQLWSPPRRFS